MPRKGQIVSWVESELEKAVNDTQEMAAKLSYAMLLQQHDQPRVSKLTLKWLTTRSKKRNALTTDRSVRCGLQPHFFVYRVK